MIMMIGTFNNQVSTESRYGMNLVDEPLWRFERIWALRSASADMTMPRVVRDLEH